MPAKAWFPTYVYESPLFRKRLEEVTGTLFEACHRIRAEDDDGRVWCQENYPTGYTSYGTQRRLHRSVPTFVELEKRIWPHVKRFAARLDMDLREATLAMTDCWINIMSKDASHPLHMHPGAVVSGTFYVRTPEGCSGITFEHPRLDKFEGTPPRKLQSRPENRRRISYPVSAGKLVLFESWLRHEVEPNTTAEERVSISFNYAWV